MAFLQEIVPFQKTHVDYKKIVFSFDARHIHPIDEMDMYRQSGEMLFSTMTTTTMSLSNSKVASSNMQSQLKIEKLSCLAKDNRINTLEQLVVKVGYDPHNCKGAEEIIKKKNADVVALQKKLKLPSTEDP